jgi:hypothetical protein
MWTVMKRSDLAQARQDLEACRTEAVQRHAQELEKLEADRAELDALRRLAAAFSDKFKKPPTVAVAPATTTAAAAPVAVSGHGGGRPAMVPVAVSGHGGGRPAAFQPWQVAPRGQPRTNFDAFSQARARGTF